MKMEQNIGKNFTTPGPNFNVDKQYDLDFDFAGQLVDTLEKINKEYPLAKLKIEDISNYDGKHFTVVNRRGTLNEDGLRLYAEKLHKINIEKLFKEIDKEKEQEENSKENWTDK